MSGARNGEFSIVRHCLLEDEKFAQVYSDDALFAGWVRLLMAADKTWPAPAPVPFGTRPSVLRKLVEAGLIDSLPHHQYLVHGMAHERELRREQVAERSEHARKAANARWERERDARNAQSDA